jgi:hypothetical protein
LGVNCYDFAPLFVQRQSRESYVVCNAAKGLQCGACLSGVPTLPAGTTHPIGRRTRSAARHPRETSGGHCLVWGRRPPVRHWSYACCHVSHVEKGGWIGLRMLLVSRECAISTDPIFDSGEDCRFRVYMEPVVFNFQKERHTYPALWEDNNSDTLFGPWFLRAHCCSRRGTISFCFLLSSLFIGMYNYMHSVVYLVLCMHRNVGLVLYFISVHLVFTFVK